MRSVQSKDLYNTLDAEPKTHIAMPVFLPLYTLNEPWKYSSKAEVGS